MKTSRPSHGFGVARILIRHPIIFNTRARSAVYLHKKSKWPNSWAIYEPRIPSIYAALVHIFIVKGIETEGMALASNLSDPEEFCYGIVGNIPVEFHSADLRSFFSHFIESNGFSCFHFRHRPEVQISTGTTTKDDRTKGKSCCVVRLSVERMNDFVKTYHGHNWVNRNKKCFTKKAVVSRIKVEGSVAGESASN